ncbi:sensor histidine kinase [Anaeromyxobacter paludicola]|uniref:histidine kinase n=1 Tax=Anaeromyxobacter paludicola TaxID=2918171 RepID=A0ABN6N3C3_9BACT|nr:ATP-binding protein [Anaeromyxobacter paludicola]BDG07456.1 hypothetical protein AMPC_05690 [Anaeromyxobacter paludicola]
MSLRLQITLLFGAILVLTMSTAAGVGERIAARAVEQAVRDRSLEVARSIRGDLDLSHDVSRGFDPARAADRLTAALRRHRNIRAAELAIRHPGVDDVIRIQFTTAGPETLFAQREYDFPDQPAALLVGSGEARAWQVDLPVKDSYGRTVAALRVETFVSDAESLAEKERRAFLAVTGVSGLVLVVAFTLILRRMLARPLEALASSMARVEEGALEEVRVPGTGRPDEIGQVARGLEAMLERLRGFNQQLQERVDAATADLAQKNRELAELNDLLVEARRDLGSKEQLAALGQLSGTIAHELGNPLNAISGHVQMLARSAAIPGDEREQLAIVEGEVKRMTAIIRRFLDSARALTPAPEPVEVGALVDEALSLTLSADVRGRLQVAREVPGDLGRVALDPSLVRHVLTNFIANAVDAMAQGGKLTVRARRDDGLLALQVADTGPGIPPEERKRIFEPFYTTKPRGKGTGLGLAICREIASALKGRIEVDSQPGRGATFTLLVPAPPSAPPR